MYLGFLNLLLNLFFRELCNYYSHNSKTDTEFANDKRIACFINDELTNFLSNSSIVDVNGYIQKYILAGNYCTF